LTASALIKAITPFPTFINQHPSQWAWLREPSPHGPSARVTSPLMSHFCFSLGKIPLPLK
jgi:hypothetical protein